MSWNSFPKAWKTIHVMTETFTQRRTECTKFYILSKFFYREQTKFAFFVTSYHFVICSEVLFILLFVF